jgi:hypothetical protein
MPMTPEHKAALARGRRESRAVKRYLECLASRRPGRPVTPERLKERLASIEARLQTESDPLKALELRQARIDASDALAQVEASSNAAALEGDFVEHAKGYGERKGISYAAWREAGVPAAVLRAAGITRGG